MRERDESVVVFGMHWNYIYYPRTSSVVVRLILMISNRRDS